ncbi:lytic transglycosylase domain-containing protein [Nitratireductor sp. StC3]|uniref:lytic transglycosylase domain-containing protein n=1 Tax=Nitratireductor sp. StC3 TaxID=2126741 RepID=UPI000D0DFA4F|nr:lytic transglycosylase domain-containing protein [Nitratireductor sp. StC3]PSM16174.1 lytic transglycosylase [Nitratireductor sp. StC3]
MKTKTTAGRIGLAALLIVLPALLVVALVDAPGPAVDVDKELTTGSVAARVPGRDREPAADSESLALLKDGLDALSAGDIDGARARRDALPADALDRKILAWAIALAGGESAATAQTPPDWPGLEALRRNSERRLAADDPEPQVVADAFSATPPQTFEGTMLLGKALRALGRDQEARALLSPFWRRTKLNARQETAFLRAFGSFLPAADHRYRAERMLYEDRIRSAERVAALAGVEALVAAWGAVIRNRDNAGALLEAVPAAQREAGYHHAKAKYLRRQGRFVEAAHVLADAPRAGEQRIDPDAWWVERRVLSRELLDSGAAETAYKVAADHSAESAAAIADAEFHAGWYALRGLGDAKKAAAHFARIAAVSSGPISLARAHYWLARTAEAGGPGEATQEYRRAAVHGTAFYGQLAAARLGQTTIAAGYPEPNAADRGRFAGRDIVAAIDRLERIGQGRRAEILYRGLADDLTSPGEIALLAARAQGRGNHFLALKISKRAAARGIDIGALAYPLGAIPASADVAAAGKALAYAVARQESEFNVAAISGAGARGLLQLLPGTAKDMARKTGLAYSATRLTSDAGYNATLGAAFLGEQLARFDGSYVLTFAGYNAGPRRAAEWATRYGDPRGADIETVIDWIERIPYTETRNYVQRVMENYQVYKMQLTGRVDIEKDLTRGR